MMAKWDRLQPHHSPERIKATGDRIASSSYQVVMVHLVILLSVVGLSLACAPGGQQPGSGQQGGSQQGGSQQGSGGQPGGQGRRKREADEAKVTLITHQRFDLEKTAAYMKVIRSLVAQHAEELGLVVDQNKIHVEPENIHGKFAAVYTILGAECSQIKSFIRTSRELKTLLRRVKLTCGGLTENVPLYHP